VRKISSLERVASVPIFAMVEVSEQKTWVKGSVAPVLASESASSFSGSPALTGSHWKLKATQEERESERSQTS